MTQQINRSIPPEVSDFVQLRLPQPVTKRLDNGLLVSEINAGPQNVIRLSLVWNLGYVDIDATKAEVSLCTSLLREGTASRTGFEIAEALEFNGAWLTTTADHHSVTINLFALNSKVEEPIDILLDIISNPTFPEDELAAYRERMAQTEELNLQKVSYLCDILKNSLVYGETSPLSKSTLPDEIRNIQRKDIIDIFCRLIKNNPPLVFLSGRFSPEIESVVLSKLSSVKFPAASGNRKIVPICPSEVRILKQPYPQAVQSAVNISIPTITRSHPDYVALRILVIMLGGFFGSRLTTNIREDKGYTYGINASLIGIYEGGTISISTQCDNRYVDRVIEEIKVEIGRLSTDGFSDEEIRNLRRYVKSQLAAILDSPFNISDYYQLNHTVGTPPDYFDQQFHIADALSSDMLTEMAIKHIDQEKLYVTVVGQF